jgi:hypothetical protein
MRFASAARRALPLVALVTVGAVWFGAQRSAQGGDPLDDGVPPGTVAFFAPGTMCPNGWMPFDPAAGRMIVGASEAAAVGRTVGSPLGDREDRTHTHEFSGTVALAPRAIAGANGSNNQGAAARAYTVAGRTAPATSGHAFIQLRACVRQ